jgi:hypothetical protein
MLRAVARTPGRLAVTDRIDAERVAGAWSTAMSLREQLAATATSIAETEDSVADTLDHLARLRPQEAERLRARAARARLFADRERAQAAVYRSCPGAYQPSAMARMDRREQGSGGGEAGADRGDRRPPP